ncbi:fatty acyl-AMP ligase [Streptomyces sp. NBC_00859]|uniref:fatty acyl-AMP ligase n=1 Tax=Streptomyces sp. NBC_00859 TaxID=2903682 RepID=UPI003868032A|nr:fatty acyl-AMP ligase [Streptomyces sp. NBC_00859]
MEAQLEARIANTFVDVVRQQADAHGDREAFAYIRDMSDGQINDTLSFRELDTQARIAAGWLTKQGGAAGDRVLLCFPPGLDFIVGFLGCLYAGMIAVPAPMPEGFSSSEDRVSKIVRDAQTVIALSDASGVAKLERWLADQLGAALPCGAVRTMDSALAASLTTPDLTPDTVALLQYTSGSTSDPKGVMITHRNLLSNMKLISECADGGPHSRSFGWLPVIHDMGLIGQVLWMLCLGGCSVLTSPTEFLRRPYRWLELLNELNIDFTVAPNFAYDLCVRTVSEEKVRGLDLSGWRVTFNGAEPIQAQSLAKFEEKFGPVGFRSETFLPCYGLAEATLLVTGTRADSKPVITTVDAELLAQGEFVPTDPVAGQRELVGSGTVDRSRVRIVDTETREALPDGKVGEIWVRGESVAQGYWGHADLNAEMFNQSVGGETGFFRTGDLGVIYEGELYVTGRLKEVLIIRGRNLYPHDLERAVRGVDPRLATGAGAVLTLDAPEGSVVVVQEIKPRGLVEDDYRALARNIQRTLVREFSIPLPSVVFVGPGRVRKTTSGKIQRSLMKQLFIASTLKPLHAELTDSLAHPKNS